MEKTVLLQLICVIVVGFSSVILVKAEDPYKYFTWTVTYGTASPLGVPQQVILINGQFPGPRLDVVTNDNIILNLINKLDEPFLLTWNGIKQRKNSWQDGVLGTNCPIPPNSNFTYKFQTKDQIGGYTYFPSTLMHKAAGGFGALNVYARPRIPVPYSSPAGDFSLLIGDWYKSSHKGLRQYLDSGKPLTFPDGVLINGQTQSSYSGDQGKTYLFRISNVGLSTSLNFRIQGHKMKLVEVEGSHTLQNIYDSLDVHVGQSVSVLVTLDQPPKDYYIVASTQFTRSVLTGTAVLHYTNSHTPVSGPVPAGPNYQVDWSMQQAKTYRWNLTANAARPNPQGSFHYGKIIPSRTIVLAVSCCLLSFLNQFFAYRTEPLVITQITVQVATLPIGHFLARVLPETRFRIPGAGPRMFSLNPGPFNIKEHVLISVFANAGAAFGSGSAYAVGIITIIKAFYFRNISFIAGWLLIITTQVLGYGWAGLLRSYVVEPSQMWWPSTLVQVSLFRALHEKDEQRMSRAKFFLIALICSFSWYVVPGYLFTTLSSISWICWVFSKSVTAQQIGSGMRGLGLGAVTLDWSVVASFLFSPLISPFFAIVNVFFGYFLIIYIVMPIAYWGLDLYSARNFPIFSSHLFTNHGQKYNISAIVNDKFQIDMVKYEEQGRIHLSMFFALTYGFGFATIAATLTHVGFFYGREIYDRFRASYKGKEDIHTRLMRKYKEIPSWWFYLMLGVTVAVSLVLCIFLNDQVQMPWWGLLFACAIAFIFTLPISIITATTNQTPGLNIITEYIMGVILPGRPIANVCFKTYGYMSMAQAVSFLSDFKLGHYMKIPPRSMFLVQFIGTIIAGTINLSVAWWLLESIENICQDDLLPADSPWTCPGDRVFFDASVIWGLVGPKRIFGSLGNYSSMNWFFLGGALGPIVVWLFHKAYPKQSWIPLINLPVLLGATGAMPPATPLNYNAWILVGTIFNFFVFRYRKQWWQRYNYILSAALDAGVAFMAVLLYFSVGMENKGLTWWGTDGEHCDLATCPTAKGINVDGCPVN